MNKMFKQTSLTKKHAIESIKNSKFRTLTINELNHVYGSSKKPTKDCIYNPKDHSLMCALDNL